MGVACGSCGSHLWYAMRSYVEKDRIRDQCSDCDTALRVSGVPDVYFRPGTDGAERNPNIADSNGDPIPLVSRAHKAEMMKRMKLREASDPVHGSRNFDPIAHRHGIESLRSADRRKHHG